MTADVAGPSIVLLKSPPMVMPIESEVCYVDDRELCPPEAISYGPGEQSGDTLRNPSFAVTESVFIVTVVLTDPSSPVYFPTRTIAPPLIWKRSVRSWPAPSSRMWIATICGGSHRTASSAGTIPSMQLSTL